MNKQIKFTLLAGVGLIAGIFLLVFIKNLLFPYQFQGSEIPFVEAAPAFSLSGVDNERLTLTDFEGKVVALYFGYTFCPDVCPTTLTELAAARSQLGADGDDVQIIMVTADPERDTADALAKYVSYFDDSFLGLTGTPAELEAIYKDYGIFVQKQTDIETAASYLVDHTSAVTIIDKEGNRRLLFPFSMNRDKMADDLRELVNE